MTGGRKIIYIASACLMLYACANRVAPTGGEKDVKPPVLLSASPPNYSTQFRSNEIVLDFDEYVQLKDVQQQLIVSPLIDPPPSVTVKKRSVLIKFDSLLKENTTYTLNFGTAITDIHEGNALAGYSYVFSTGDSLNSDSIHGVATDALLQSAGKETRVFLYTGAITDDSLPLKQRPDYAAVTDDHGNFNISHLAPGTYTIVAVEDKNANYKNDSPEEESISLKQVITVPDTGTIDLLLFKTRPQRLYIKNIRNVAFRWDAALNRPAPDAIPVALTGAPVLYDKSINADTLFIWRTDTTPDSLAVVITEGNEKDTATLIREKTRAIMQRNFIEQHNGIAGIRPDEPLKLLLVNPAVAIDTTKLILKMDTVVTDVARYSFTDSLKRRMEVQSKWIEGGRYSLQILPGGITDMFGRTNDSLMLPFTIREESESGTVEFNIQNLGEGTWILQLISNDQAAYEVKNISAGKSTFDWVAPAIYKARLIKDDNGNGRWDAGDYFKNKEPEKVIYYSGTVQARANWELVVDWILK